MLCICMYIYVYIYTYGHAVQGVVRPRRGQRTFRMGAGEEATTQRVAPLEGESSCQCLWGDIEYIPSPQQPQAGIPPFTAHGSGVVVQLAGPGPDPVTMTLSIVP